MASKRANVIAQAERSAARKPSRIAKIRRGELIEAAIRDIAANGYDRVTVASICQEAGFSRGLIGHYFDGKDALLFEAVKTVSDRLGGAIKKAVVGAGSDPHDRLSALVHASFTAPGFTSDNVAVWVALAGTARWSEPLATLYRDIWNEYRQRVGNLVAQAAAAAGREIDVQSTTLSFSQLIEGLWIGWNANPDGISPAMAEKICHDYLKLVLGARKLN